MPLPADYISRARRASAKGRGFIQSFVRHDSFVNPAAIDADGYLTTLAGPNATTITPTLDGALAVAGVGVPDFARNVVITVTHATAVVAESGTITGKDRHGNTITEAWSVTAAGTSKVFTGKKAFSKVTSVTITAATDASANSNVIGTGVVFGLSERAASVVLVAEEEDGAAPTAGVLVKGSSAAAADYYGTYDPNSAPNGALDFDIWYLVDTIEAVGAEAPNA